MRPFPLCSEADGLLTERYPKPPDFARACGILDTDDQVGVIRSFIVEGVPAFLSRNPTLYDTLRRYIAETLGLHPDDVTIVGSARIGYSLSPPPAYGIPFGANSDLDFAAVSRQLFERLVGVFDQWKADAAAGRENPRNAREHKFWKANLDNLPLNIENGFLDSKKLPNRYEQAMKVNQTMWKTVEKLRLTLSLGHNPYASLRVYPDWNAFYRQQLINLRATLRKLDMASTTPHQRPENAK
jgi:hypothetical protein